MINLYLDDLRDCPDGFELAKTMEEAVSFLKENKINILSLDHDLGEENGKLLKTGYDLVKWICEFYEEENLSIKAIYLHTDNNVGRENMFETLKAAQRRGFISEKIKIYHYYYVPNKYTEK